MKTNRKTKQTKSRRAAMPCPHCAERLSEVVRTTARGDGLQRIRRCLKCGRRFITREATAKSDTSVTTLATDVVSLIHAMGIVPKRNPSLDSFR
jgi:hypothetical protein